MPPLHLKILIQPLKKRKEKCRRKEERKKREKKKVLLSYEKFKITLVEIIMLFMQHLLRTLQQLRSENDIALQIAKFVFLSPPSYISNFL